MKENVKNNIYIYMEPICGLQKPYMWNLKKMIQMNLFTKQKWTQSVSEKATATHSSTLAWKIPWMEEPGRLQSMGSLRVGHD